MKSPSPSPNQPPKSDRVLIKDEVDRYIATLLKDYKNTIPLAQHWPLLERLVLYCQRTVEPTATPYQAIEHILTTLERFKTQGDLDIQIAKPS